MKAILFDFEGTLAYYTKKPSPINVSRLIRNFGYEIYYQEWEAVRKFVFFIDFPKGGINNWDEFIRKIFKRLGLKVDKSIIRKVSEYYKHNTKFKFFNDVDIIRRVRIKKGIVTTIPRFYFSDLDLNGFDVVITGKEAKAAKPNPKCFLKALEKLKIKPEEALFVGDSIECDIEPAKSIGMDVIFLDRKNKYKNIKYKKIKTLTELRA